MSGYGGLDDDSKHQAEKLFLALEEMMKNNPGEIFFHWRDLEGFCKEKWPNWQNQYEINGSETTVGSSIRRVLNTKSADSKYFGKGAKTALDRRAGGKHDLFANGGTGLWGIREEVERRATEIHSSDIRSMETSRNNIVSISEGGVKFRLIGERERSPEIKRMALEENGYSCMACELNFGTIYGERGVGFIEVHHSIPLSEGERETRVEDLVVLCSNCHRMVHRKKPLLTLQELRKKIHPDYLEMMGNIGN